MNVSQVPSATRTLRVLRYLASRPTPAPLENIARACELPRSTAYHLLNTMIAEGFVTHHAAEHRYGLGLGAFEVGSGYQRQDALVKVARPPLAAMADRLTVTASLVVPSGRDVVHVCDERGPTMAPVSQQQPVRLPARVSAGGRALLAGVAAARVRSQYSAASAFVDGYPVGPRDLATLEELLGSVRRRGFAVEEGEVSPGSMSVAAAVVVPGSRDTGQAAVVLTCRRDQRPSAAHEILGREAQRAADAIAHVVAEGRGSV